MYAHSPRKIVGQSGAREIDAAGDLLQLERASGRGDDAPEHDDDRITPRVAPHHGIAEPVEHLGERAEELFEHDGETARRADG